MKRWLNHFYNSVVMGRLICKRPKCSHDRVGISQFCRQHTDEILSRR